MRSEMIPGRRAGRAHNMRIPQRAGCCRDGHRVQAGGSSDPRSLPRLRRSSATDRLILVFALVLAANATLSLAYVKDDIMSVSVEQLRNDALSMRAPNPRFEPPWVEPVWGD